jgi:anthranilate/para-aminobenzoate synthase component II
MPQNLMNSKIDILAVHKDIRSHIEAIRIKGYPAYGVQFHPENLNELSGMRYTENLIKQLLIIK